MEEDIKIVKNLINHIRAEEKLQYGMGMYIQSIENILERYEKVEEENENLVLRQLDINKWREKEFIHKSAIKDKIYEIKSTSSQINGDYFMNNYKIEVLQELLEERK
jgi:hypothetical protein